MNGLSISQSAKIEIEQLFADSECRQPVASLGQSSAVFSPSAGLLDAIERDAGDNELLQIGKGEFENTKGKLQFKLTVFVYERHKCNASEVVDINGINFVMPQNLNDSLAGLLLDFDQDGFVFRDSNGSVRDPFSI